MTPSTQYIRANESGFKGPVLDALLAVGYYRMQHFMFTCNETPTSDDGFTIPVFWLRTLIKRVQPNKSAQAIIKRNSALRVDITTGAVSEEIEELYTLYRNHKPFSTSETCFDYLHTLEMPNPFDNMMVQVRSGGQLVAVGYFDKGAKTIAGIMNIYHPRFEKFSLGKFLMIQKLQYALQQGMDYYYTGYISTGSTRFDYKTFPDANAVEVYLPTENRWVNYSLLGKEFLEDYYINHLV